MCCGQVSKPNKQQVKAQQTIVQPINEQAPPMVSTPNLDNINSQRASRIISENYHKLRFRNFG